MYLFRDFKDLIGQNVYQIRFIFFLRLFLASKPALNSTANHLKLRFFLISH